LTGPPPARFGVINFYFPVVAPVCSGCGW